MGGTKAIISKHKGWMTIDLEAQKDKPHIRDRSEDQSTFAGKEKLTELRPTWMKSRPKESAKGMAGTLSPREDSGSLYQLFKARSPMPENLRFEKKRVMLFDGKRSTKSAVQTTNKPFTRDNHVQ